MMMVVLLSVLLPMVSILPPLLLLLPLTLVLRRGGLSHRQRGGWSRRGWSQLDLQLQPGGGWGGRGLLHGLQGLHWGGRRGDREQQRKHGGRCKMIINL